jgi:putative flippase GtrA
MKFFTFEAKSKDIFKQFLSYTVFAIAFRASEYFIFHISHSMFSLDYRIIIIIVLSVSTVIKFFTYKYIFEDNKK